MNNIKEYIPTSCQWIHEDGSFCGREVPFNSSWCEEHHNVVFIRVDVEDEEETIEEEICDDLDIFDDLEIEQDEESEEDEEPV